MRRKIIRQGNNSYTLTLPIKWIRELGLKEGGEVSIEEEGSRLVVAPEIVKKKREISIAVEEEYEKNIRFLLNELYRQGYDRVGIDAKTPKTIGIIQYLVEVLFFDMEVMEKKEKSCVLEVISEPTLENYNAILKKMIFIIQETMELIISSKKPSVGDLTGKYRKYDNFCRRYVYSYVKGKEGIEMNSLLIHLLMIQTDLQRLAKAQKAPADISLLRDVAALYKETYGAFFRKNKESLYDANKKINRIIESKTKGKISPAAHYCVEIARILYSAIVPMLGLSIEITSAKG